MLYIIAKPKGMVVGWCSVSCSMSPFALMDVVTVRRSDGMVTWSWPLIEKGLKYLSDSGKSPSPFPNKNPGEKVLIFSATLAGPIPPISAPKPVVKIVSCSGLLNKTYLKPNSGLPAPEVEGPFVGCWNRYRQPAERSKSGVRRLENSKPTLVSVPF